MPASRRAVLLGTAALLGAVRAGTGSAAPAEAAGRRPFGPYGSPSVRLDSRTLYVDPAGRGDHTTLQAAVTATGTGATAATGWTIVLAAATYRERVVVPPTRPYLTLLGATRRAADTVVVLDTAAGTAKPDGAPYGTTGSATVTLQADGLTARDLTFANDWLRADHPETTATQAVAVKVTGDRCAFHDCRFLGHQDTLYADSPALSAFARQYFDRCYVEGDVDFVFGRATAVLDRCELRTLARDVTFTPQGFVFAPSTARANPHGFLAQRCAFTGTAPDGAFRLARPWVPSSDTTAWPMLTVRQSVIGPGINAPAPYADMSASYPWQDQRFAEYADVGPGARVTDAAERPQLTAAQAALLTRETHLAGADGWRPWEE